MYRSAAERCLRPHRRILASGLTRRLASREPCCRSPPLRVQSARRILALGLHERIPPLIEWRSGLGAGSYKKKGASRVSAWRLQLGGVSLGVDPEKLVSLVVLSEEMHK